MKLAWLRVCKHKQLENKHMPKKSSSSRTRGRRARRNGFWRPFANLSSGSSGLLTPVQALSRLQLLLVVGFVAVAGVAVVAASHAATLTYTLWTDSYVPKEIATWDAGKSLELGVKFKATEGGTVLGVRFYKDRRNTGTHLGRLWDSQGNKLADATFTNETASGWQTVSFSQPVSITPGEIYIVSYHTNTGYYGIDEYYFNGASRVSNSLKAPANTQLSVNGVAKYGSGFPTSNYHGSNYWVDVMFRPASIVAPATSPSASPTPSPTPSPSASPATTTSTSLLRPYGLGIAPYHYIPWGGSLDAARTASGINTYVAAFMLGGGSCTPAWDGDSSLGLSSTRANQIATDMAKLRSNGGDALISFGGASGSELALNCSTASALKTAYRSVIDKYGVNKIDFDIEGATASNTTANSRRADALLALQQELPGVRIWVTLAVSPSGLDGAGKAIIQQLRDRGVAISGVNIMTMDYGIGSTQMGQVAIQAAQATFNQLKALFPGNSDASIWKSIGLTPMIGKNDTLPETFTLANATELHDFALQKGIGMTSFWNVDRDKSCPYNAGTLSDVCSGVVQSPYQFGQLLTIPAQH
jgi:hypothetical protein